jgi:hypothetical protein
MVGRPADSRRLPERDERSSGMADYFFKRHHGRADGGEHSVAGA